MIAGLMLVALLSACGSTPTSIPGEEATRAKFNQKGYEAALKLMKQKKYSDAVASLENVIRDSGKRAGPFINLGIAYRELGKFDDSKKALLTATQIDPRNAIAFNELGLAYRKLGDFTSAKNAYLESIDNKSRYSLPYRNLGILCDIYLQDLSCAIRNYKKYQSLTDNRDKKVELWIVDLKRRAGKRPKGK
jgi:tetratricopeptide (TPR) repeat protein